MEIKKAINSELVELNQIISSSKSFWNYDQDYIKAAIPLIQISEAWLDHHQGLSIYCGSILCGFMGIEITNHHWKLEHLWILPTKIRNGLGTKAISYLLLKARASNVQTILLLPDPPAEGFYIKTGAKFTGIEIKSRINNGPIFREMEFKL